MTPAPQPLSDDDIRWLLVRTAASLGRLWARLERLSVRPGRHPMCQPVAREIEPPEPWLDQVAHNTALSGVIAAVVLAQSLLIDEAASRRSPDRRRICLIIQHVSCGATNWSVHTLRMAQTLGVKLAATVREETHGVSVYREIHRLDGTWDEAAR